MSPGLAQFHLLVNVGCNAGRDPRRFVKPHLLLICLRPLEKSCRFTLHFSGDHSVERWILRLTKETAGWAAFQAVTILYA